MKCKALLCLGILISLSLKAPAQGGKNENKNFPLKEGGRLDLNKFTFSTVKNYTKNYLKLSDFKHKKIIILDFWTRSCSYCIASMPKLEQLQKEFEDDIQILLITPDSEEDLKKVWQRSAILKNIKLPIILSDSVLYTKVFRHFSDPYHVWIDYTGKVIATLRTTNADVLKEYMRFGIKASETYEEVSPPKDYNNPRKSFLDLDNSKFANNIVYSCPYIRKIDSNDRTKQNLHVAPKRYNAIKSFFIAGLPNYINGHNKFYLTDSLGDVKGIKLFQYTLEYLIKLVAHRDFFTDTTSESIPVFVEKEAQDKIELYNSSISDVTKYYTENLYTYESYMEDYTEEKAKALLRQDIARYFGIVAVKEKKKIVCGVLRVYDTLKLNKYRAQSTETMTEYYSNSIDMIFNNVNLKTLLSTFRIDNKSSFGQIPFYSESKLPSCNFSFTIHSSSLKITEETSEKIKRDLARLGISLTFKEITMDVVSIKNAIN